ncbi:MAG TPA: hypothetical protein VFA66_04430 [Gaiellaceae bacterium]|nr:hypothetical protein [Gaiellaceae bacterium]
MAEAPHTPSSGRVGLERPLHKWAANWIDLDRSHFPAVLDAANVDISKRRLADRAARLCFLDGAFNDLVGQIAAVELRNRAHDPVQQEPGGRLVDVLATRDQGSSSRLDRKRDLDVVRSVAGEPVDLVDDDVVDGVVADER